MPACWLLHVVDFDPTLSESLRDWCGVATFGQRCFHGARCKFVHPQRSLRLCGTLQPPSRKKLAPMLQIPLDEAECIATDRVRFIEHSIGGIIWGAVFPAHLNDQLLVAFLRSGFACGLPASGLNSVPVSALLAEDCWHRIAFFAGVRSTLQLQQALGPRVGWLAWLWQHGEHSDTDRRCGSACGQYPQLHHGRPVESCESQTPLLCRRAVVFVNQQVRAAHLGSLMGAAVECACVHRCLGGQHTHVSMDESQPSSIYLSPPSLNCSLGSAAMYCLRDDSTRVALRNLNLGAEVLASRASSGLHAFLTTAELRVLRHGDCKSAGILPRQALIASNHWRPSIEIDESRNLLISTTCRGLQLFDLEAPCHARRRGRPSIVPSLADEWDLRATERGLLVATSQGVTLRDLGRELLPVVQQWGAPALCLTAAGALTTQRSAGTLELVDPRRPQPVVLGFSCFGPRGSPWVCAAQGPRGGSLFALGSAEGNVSTVDCRMMRSPLWSLGSAGDMLRRGELSASHSMLFAHLSVAGAPCLQAMSWQGTPLALFANLRHVPDTRDCGPASYICGSSVLIGGSEPVPMKPVPDPVKLVARNVDSRTVFRRGQRSRPEGHRPGRPLTSR